MVAYYLGIIAYLYFSARRRKEGIKSIYSRKLWLRRSVRSEILALSIPAIASNITTPLLGLADVAVVGHIGSAVYIGAIALGGAVMNMLYWVFSFLRLGSRRYGSTGLWSWRQQSAF